MVWFLRFSVGDLRNSRFLVIAARILGMTGFSWSLQAVCCLLFLSIPLEKTSPLCSKAFRSLRDSCPYRMRRARAPLVAQVRSFTAEMSVLLLALSAIHAVLSFRFPPATKKAGTPVKKGSRPGCASMRRLRDARSRRGPSADNNKSEYETVRKFSAHQGFPPSCGPKQDFGVS